MYSFKEGTQNDVKGRWKGSTRHRQNVAQSKPIVYCLWQLCHVHTVDGRNPAPPGMHIKPFWWHGINYQTQLVQHFFPSTVCWPWINLENTLSHEKRVAFPKIMGCFTGGVSQGRILNLPCIFFLHHQHLAFSPTTGEKDGQEQKIASCFVSQAAATASQNKHNQDKDDNTNIANRHATNWTKTVPLSGHSGDWAQGLPHAERVWYH